MFTRERNRHGRSGSGFNSPRSGRFQSRPARHVKKLPAHLFVNKAVAAQEAAPVAISHQFSDFAFQPALAHNITVKGYTTPTPIQDKAIPAILAGRDVTGVANTGTGKTAAFLLPLVNKVLLNRNENILVVAPTRELALQIQDELRSFTYGMRIYSVLTIGGASMDRQAYELRRGCNFVIGTPGRLKDLINQRILSLARFQTIVLDEVDRMLDIGFIRDVQFLIAHMPAKRHSLFFTATITPKVNEVIRTFVHNPVTISVKTHETADTVEQDVIHVEDKTRKIDMLHDLLVQDGFEKVMVFGRTKWGIEKLTSALEQRGLRVAAIHGNKSQGQRQRALTAFKRNQVQVLLATDVASRGIDVEDVTHVINYDAPESYDDYVHRIGRTGRANKHGMAITFVER